MAAKTTFFTHKHLAAQRDVEKMEDLKPGDKIKTPLGDEYELTETGTIGAGRGWFAKLVEKVKTDEADIAKLKADLAAVKEQVAAQKGK